MQIPCWVVATSILPRGELPNVVDYPHPISSSPVDAGSHSQLGGGVAIEPALRTVADLPQGAGDGLSSPRCSLSLTMRHSSVYLRGDMPTTSLKIRCR